AERVLARALDPRAAADARGPVAMVRGRRHARRLLLHRHQPPAEGSAAGAHGRRDQPRPEPGRRRHLFGHGGGGHGGVAARRACHRLQPRRPPRLRLRSRRALRPAARDGRPEAAPAGPPPRQRQHPGPRRAEGLCSYPSRQALLRLQVIEKEDPRGRKYYWIGGNEYQHEDIPGSDCNAVLRDGLVSVTPLHLDLTAHDLAAEVARWTVEGFPRVEVGSVTSRTPS